MNLHEYQSKELMAGYGIPLLKGVHCCSPDEAQAAAVQLGGSLCVVKAQVHAGGRGKGGGIKLAKTPAEAKAFAKDLLGTYLVTPQTGVHGKLVSSVYIEQGCAIDKEFYLSILLERSRRCIAVVASASGGMDIEEVARVSPEKIFTVGIDPKAGFQPFYGMSLGFKLGLDLERARSFSKILSALYRIYTEKDLSLIEVNPLVLTKEGQLVVLDAKCALDDNALFRHPELKTLLDPSQEDPKDLRAAEFGLSYVALDGTIGCMVNGAGLAMATMDIIKAYGGEPANFLDVGGGASKETVTEAFKI